MDYKDNPFPAQDTARHAIWEMLVTRDIEAFITQDWNLVADDFSEDQFFGLNARYLNNPDSWRLDYPTLQSYRDEWLRQSRECALAEYDEPLGEALFRVTHLRDIDINLHRAVVHKKFNGVVARADGTSDTFNWQTLYFCTAVDNDWKISGFVGYLPYSMT